MQITASDFDIVVTLSRKSRNIATRKMRPTQRAADKWDSARFLAFFAAWSLFRFDSESPLQPIAATNYCTGQGLR
jgi:hypothetical protein